MTEKKIKIIVTLGPSTSSEADLKKIKSKGVDFVRINMSHSSLDDLQYFIGLAKKIDIPFIIDTEGSQLRTGDLKSESISLQENDEIMIYAQPMRGDSKKISLRPGHILAQLEPGDLMYVDFDALILRVSDVATASKGYITAKAVNSGSLGRNKGVVIHSAIDKKFDLPPLSEKDYASITIGLEAGIGHIAASFMRSGDFVKEVRRATKNTMRVISKIECMDGLDNLEEIIRESDAILLDRGDMSKEVPIEKIPFLQRIVIDTAKRYGKDVFVATNLLETMVTKRRPTRAEVHDVIASILDGAGGLILSAETAIGRYPMECITMMNTLVRQAQSILRYQNEMKATKKASGAGSDLHYLIGERSSSNLVPPHGGVLVSRILRAEPDPEYAASLQAIDLSKELQMDVEQIAVGSFSPLEGFMDRNDFQSVLDTMRLTNGVVWTIPIILDISQEQASRISIGDDVVLRGDNGPMALMHVSDMYTIDADEVAEKLYGTGSIDHPGVRWLRSLKPVLLGGSIELFKRRSFEFQEYFLTPRQTRRLFEEKNWSTVVGFHTRNVIHRSHEFIQRKALEDESADGLFIHPVVGKKKVGDYNTKYIIQSYQQMIRDFYPSNKVVFSTFSTFSRYAGPREAIFTALCRKNFGCSHFIVGRDHTGVGNFYHPNASHDIFDKFPDLGIKAIKFDKVFYSKKLARHIHAKDSPNHDTTDIFHISGTEARKMFEQGKIPPEWFMRPEISKKIVDSIAKGEEVFVKDGATDKKIGSVLWFSGLSGSGKTTIAENLKQRLEEHGKKVTIIDGDDVRSKLHKHLGFSRDDIRENNRRIAELALDKAKGNDFVLVPIISPYREDRAAARSLIGPKFIELFVDCPIEICIKRDAKGLYRKALAGEIDNFIGVADSSPYETPLRPDIKIKTDQVAVDKNIGKIMLFLEKKKDL